MLKMKSYLPQTLYTSKYWNCYIHIINPKPLLTLLFSCLHEVALALRQLNHIQKKGPRRVFYIAINLQLFSLESLPFACIKWNSRPDLKQIAKKFLAYNWEISLFKLKGCTLTVILRSGLTKLIKKNWITSCRKFETQNYFKNLVLHFRTEHAWISQVSWTEISCYHLCP